MVCTAPKKSPGYSFSLQPSQVPDPRPPRCHSQCCPFRLLAPSALRPQHGTPAPPLPVTTCDYLWLPVTTCDYLWLPVWGWWWCPGWTACYFPLHTPHYSVSSQEIWVLILRGTSTGCYYFFAPEQQQTPFFLYQLFLFYEQANSRTLWLKAFPCKPRKNLGKHQHGIHLIEIKIVKTLETRSSCKKEHHKDLHRPAWSVQSSLYHPLNYNLKSLLCNWLLLVVFVVQVARNLRQTNPGQGNCLSFYCDIDVYSAATLL